MTRLSIVVLILSASLLARPLLANEDFSVQADELLTTLYDAEGPGASVVVSRQGAVVFNRAYGQASVELSVPMESAHILRLASLTKQFAAAGILALVDDGEIALNDPISKFLPGFPVADVTVHQLLNHTSGIQSYTGIPGYMTSERIRKDLTTDELVAVFADEPVNFEPGETFAYNNSGYVLVGAVIEAITGQAWNDFLRERFFEPNGMDSLDAYSDGEIVPMRVDGYEGSAEDFQNASFISMTQPHAAGALSATALDVDRWQQLLHGGELISDAAYQAMTTPDPVTAEAGNGSGYGYGLGIGEWMGQPAYHHGGGINGFSTYALWLPGADLSVAVLSNRIGAGTQPQDVALQLVGLAMGQPYPRHLPTAEWADSRRDEVQGTYRIDENTVRTLRVAGTQLISQRQGGPSFVLRPVSDDRLVFEDSLSSMTIERDDGGNVVAVVLHSAWGGEGERAERISSDIERRAATEVERGMLERLVGEYELQPGFVITATVVDGGLQVQATGQAAFPVSAENPTRYFNDEVGIELQFELPDAGPATGMIVFQGGQEMPAPRVKED